MLRFLPVLALPILPLTVGSALAATADLRRPYAVDAPYGFEQGCYEPCACPIMISQRLGGGFQLRPVGWRDGFIEFDLRDVELVIELYEGTTWTAVGQGTYRIRPDLVPLQRLQLELTLNGEVQELDSGVVEAEARFPEIDVTVNMNDHFCFDTVYRVMARPRNRDGRVRMFTNDVPKTTAETWGAVKARFD